MKNKSLNRLKKVFWGLGVGSLFVILLMTFVVRSNPDHFTRQYPEYMKLNGSISYMTLTQKHAIIILFGVFLGCVFVSMSLEYCAQDVKSRGLPTSRDDEISRD